ncbi:MAG: glycosyltransferase [Planctomycetota bacterium]|nr:glycosyltransferase [Planctomycetota bacterium]
MTEAPLVSVLMPTYQGMEFLKRVLDALAEQVTPFAWEMIAIDSSSSDGTWEFLGERATTFPVSLERERIHGVEFDHGDTRNLLEARSRGRILVFLTQDAIPASEHWLATLVANFDDPGVGAVTCRNVPRPDAEVLTKIFSATDPGYVEGRREMRLPDAATYAAMGPHEKRLLYNFNDVAAAYRRDLWERHPFPRTNFGEDILMARAFLEAGFTVVYDDEATVEHSHDYDEAETEKRAAIDATFNAEWLDRICVGSVKDADVLTDRLSAEDSAALQEQGFEGEELARLEDRGRALRRAAFIGLHAGGRTSVRRPETRMRADGTLRLLYVVHGFPPDTWAGTEIYTYNIAKEMQRRGHDVQILARGPGAGDEPEFTCVTEEFQGLAVHRMTHRLAHAGLEESYLKRGPEAVFRGVLEEFEPDVVHFQHLIHLSAGLVEIARRRGIATVVTCHDYWALCSRVQMIRPDGSICPTNRGSGGYRCVKETGLGLVERAAALDRAGGAVFEAVAGLVKGTSHRAEEYAALRAREGVVPTAYARADLRISPSRFLRDKYLEHSHLARGGFDPHTFLFSDNGMRTDHVEALEKAPDAAGRVRFGFVGSLVWYKGGEVLVEAMRALQARGLGDRAHLNVYGGFDPKTDEHHRRLAELAEDAPVTFHGRFDNARLSEVYAEIDVLVVPSVWYENSPITIHEAFLTGTPVLASSIGGMAEFVRDGVDGLHFAVGDALDLAAKMERVVSEDGLLERLQSAEWMRVKTIDEDGAMTEARYRSLATIVREAVGDDGPLLEVAAVDAVERTGAVEIQAPDRLLLRPESSVELSLSPLSARRFRLRVELAFLPGEDSLALAGRLVPEGGAPLEIPAMLPEGNPGPPCVDFEVTLEASPRTIAVETGPGQHLRLVRLVLLPLPEPALPRTDADVTA